MKRYYMNRIARISAYILVLLMMCTQIFAVHKIQMLISGSSSSMGWSIMSILIGYFLLVIFFKHHPKEVIFMEDSFSIKGLIREKVYSYSTKITVKELKRSTYVIYIVKIYDTERLQTLYLSSRNYKMVNEIATGFINKDRIQQ